MWLAHISGTESLTGNGAIASLSSGCLALLLCRKRVSLVRTDGPPLLQPCTYGRIGFKADRPLVSQIGRIGEAGPRQQLGTGRPVRLIPLQPPVSAQRVKICQTLGHFFGFGNSSATPSPVTFANDCTSLLAWIWRMITLRRERSIARRGGGACLRCSLHFAPSFSWSTATEPGSANLPWKG